MKYLPWIAGGAALGLAARGRRAPREGLSYFSASWIANAEEQARAYKTKELFAYMPPEEFLALAMPFSHEGESPSKLKNVLRLLTENTRFYDGPALSFDETGQVYGHEGRHRATALLRMGVARIPVLLRARGGTGIRWGEQDDPTAWDYNKNLPSWLLSEKPWSMPARDMAAWRQKRVAAPWYTRGPERGQLRPEYRVPSTGRTAKRGRRAIPSRSYHLSTHKFDRFKQIQPSSSRKGVDLGFHFGSQQTALTAANKLYREGRVKPGDTVYLYEVALDARRPLVLAEGRRGGWRVTDILDRVLDGEYSEDALIRMGFTREDIDGYFEDEGPISPSGANLKDLSWDPLQEQRETVAWLESRGYNAIEYENTFEGGGLSHIVFRPSQVRILNVTPYIVPDYAGAASRHTRLSWNPKR